ncbi:Gfo/Idh/MocA family oxidoreductase [Phyllobacterium sp. 0TCS1.6C]|uniref:Gfo/Idh/MocA family protein n=1 Tax=unclassified Phyllobacterium TaxID=2638441 RepID=UPI002264D8BA|nr:MULTISPECIES: Gfo/Idh/MocA family oxidoreductase [unclassified Phyllobacterium]MCX8282034.1 Gfo/Idh/MocA family oxidoreductase [Phyllobacterium sp. 0TCS1.6C]MCX8296274.1 Gfo/Idh/MocA family oxidoreductase [Phyllobacterium sp. 0TCS1.6A]
MPPINLAIVGVGKIVRDQHLPSIARGSDFRLVATASRHGTVEGVDAYKTIDEMLEAADVAAVSLCMPPQYRYEAARKALSARKHVFLEKPPGATLSEVADLDAMARDKGVSLFASWHSRYAPAVESARSFLASTTVRSVEIIWKEDVRHWHPNQEWIWQAGGLGVFDPGINALSIMTHILPRPAFITASTLEFPENRDAPIAAELQLEDAEGRPIRAVFDWRQTGRQTWDILAETDAGQMVLSEGGSKLSVGGELRSVEPEQEYFSLYSRFAELIAAGISDVDIAPLRHVADAFLLGKRKLVEPFHD